jgi:predicted anti-sigma-YlaC factor YlaD
LNECSRPLDPIDAEAVAAGAEPLFALDAATHAAVCAACGASVDRSRALTQALEELPGPPGPLPDLAGRVIRLRAFSAKERRTYAIWRAPVLLSAALGVAGLALVVGPAVSAGDQAGLGAAAVAPLLAFLRSAARWATDLARVAPSGLDGLAEALSGERAIGLVSLLVLLPSVFGLTRIFARARSRR